MADDSINPDDEQRAEERATGEGRIPRWIVASLRELGNRVWAIVAAVVVAVAVPLVAGVVGGSSSTTTDSQSSTARRSSASTSEVPNTAPAGLSVINTQVGEDPQFADIILHNKGHGRVVVNQAIVRVMRIFRLTLCNEEGDIPLSASYNVLLPTTLSSQTTTKEVGLHDQIGTDQADRFRLRFAVEGSNVPTVPGSRTTNQSNVYLYQLEIGVRTDSMSAPSVGRVVIALPHVPWSGEYLWDTTVAAQWPKSGLSLDRNLVACWQRNNNALRSALSLPGDRSDELTSSGEALRTPPRSQ